MEIRSGGRDLLNLNLRLAATPAIRLEKATGVQTVPLSTETGGNGFSFEVDATLPYDKLSGVLHAFLQGKRLELTEGFIRQHLILEGAKLYPDPQNKLVAEVPFSGSFHGTLYVMGTPFYNVETRRVELQEVTYDLKTKSLLLKGAKWLFGSLILDEIKKFTAVDVTKFYSTAAARLTEGLNKMRATGVQATGAITDITITSISARQHELLIRGQCRGTLELTLSEQLLEF
jgi:hypothetical protein